MFEKIICHDENKKLFEKCIHGGNISHAYLFFGKEGIGKCTFAKEFAKELLNVENLDSSTEYKYISRLEGKKDIVIEQIRKVLIDDVYERPLSGNYKVYIIDDAQYLNISAQNALLKTLEEPPDYVVIILIASSMSYFLPTIISRVSMVSFSNIKNEKIEEYIEKNYNVNFNLNLLNFVDGSLGLAINIVKNDMIDKYEKINKLYELLCKKDVISIFKLKDDIEFSEETIDYLEYLLYSKLNYSCTDFTQKAKVRLKNNGNYDVVIDNMLLKIIDNIL